MFKVGLGLGLSLLSIPFALASPAARWGHQAVYVESQQAMYVIGGQVIQGDQQITNDVLFLPLNQSSPSFTTVSSDGLPPHAFAAATLSKGGNSIVVMGGMTMHCGSDSLTHTLDLTSAGRGWKDASPLRFVRRRGAGAAWVDNGSADGEVMVIGGISDKYVCSSGTYTYPVADVLSLPLGSAAPVSSRNLPAGLTGTNLAVSDFALAHAPDHSLYLIGGQDASGQLVQLSTIGKWSSADGWVSQATGGDVPTGRLGATLVAHPTLDLLVLHGGSGSDSGDSLLALLNTTTWEWSAPSALQPPSSTGAAYHSSIMTSSGVMITAFGLGTNGSPRSDMFYLDMRDPTGTNWSWKSTWDATMLQAYSATNTGATNTNGVVAPNPSQQADSSAPSSKKKTATIAVPVVIAVLLLVPLAVYLIRRQVRINRKRRMARHFSFSAQDDDGDFTRPIEPLRLPRRTQTQFGFGKDANEKEGTVLHDILSAVKRLSRRVSTDSTGSPRLSMRRTSRLNEKTMKWEEIDFGLGQVDLTRNTSRASSFSAGQHRTSIAGVASTCSGDPFSDEAGVLVSITESSPPVGTPTNDGQAHLLPPLQPISPLSTTAFRPSQEDGLDWNMLARELSLKPAFRSIDPGSTLRSHAHPESLSPRTSSPSQTMSRVTLPSGRRVSETMPFGLGNPHLARLNGSPRAVSSPLAGRPLIDQRRGSAPVSRPLPYTPGSSGNSSPSPRVVSYDAPVRRASNPMFIPVSAPVPELVMPEAMPNIADAPSRLRVVNFTDSDADVESGESGVAI